MKTIPLTQGKVAFVDDDDYDRLNEYLWCYHPKGYAVRNCPTTRTTIRMHRVVTNAQLGEEVDHKNRNKLDNQKSNLRIVSESLQRQNCGPSAKNTSGYVGVGWHSRDCRWRAYIKAEDRHMSLGYFNTAEDAARAYNEAALKYYGPDAYTNPIY